MEMIIRIDISKALFRYLTMKSAELRFRCHYYDLSYSTDRFSYSFSQSNPL
jgi:hypothetical protein